MSGAFAHEEPLRAWLEGLAAEHALGKLELRNLGQDTFCSLVLEPGTSTPRLGPASEHSLNSAASVRRPDSRLPSIRRAFGQRTRKALLVSCPPSTRDGSDVSIDKIAKDVQRVRLDLAAVKADKHLQRHQGQQSAEKPTGRARALRPKDAGTEEHGRYMERLQGIAAKLLKDFDANGDGRLDVQEARRLFRRLAGRAAKGAHAPAPVERGSVTHLGEGEGLGEPELVQLAHLGGGALGHVSQTQGRYCATQRPFARSAAVTCRLPDTAEAEVPAKPPAKLVAKPPAKFGEPPPWQSRARVLQGGLRGRKSHREQLREELRHEAGPPAPSALNDNVVLAQVTKAVRDGDIFALSTLVKAHSLWAEPNPTVISWELQQKLATRCYRFPLLFMAAYSGALAVWQLLLREVSGQPEALTEDVEGWTLPMLLCMACPAPSGEKDSKKLLSCLLEVSRREAWDRPLLAQCLLLPQDEHWEGDASAQPVHLLLERENWPDLVAFLVESGGGFPHDEEQPRMALVSAVLAERGLLGDFLAACEKGGDVPRPQTQAFAGLYLGILKKCVPWVQCLTALQALLKAGLAPTHPLTSSQESWPLHAAARHNCRAAAQVLLVAKADPFARNARGQTALEVAKANRSWATASLIRRAVQSDRASEGLTLRVAEALARHVEEIHDKRVAADVDLVASALVAHLEGVTAQRAADAVAKAEEAGRQPEEAGPDLQEAVVEEHEDVDSLHSDAVNMETVASVLASLLGLPQDESPRSESIQEHEAVDSEHTDDANVQAVAQVLAGLVAAADLGSFAGVQEAQRDANPEHEAMPKEAASDSVQKPEDAGTGRDETAALAGRVLAGLVLASDSRRDSAVCYSIQEHEDVDTDADDLNAETVALAGRVLAGLVLASDSRRDSALPREAANDSVQEHEDVDMDTDDLNVDTVARVLAGRVLTGLVLASDSRRNSENSKTIEEDVESEHEENLRRGARLWAGLALDDPGRDPDVSGVEGPQRSELMQDGEEVEKSEARKKAEEATHDVAQEAMAMRQGEPGERIQDQEDSDGQLQSTAREAAERAAAGGASQASPAKPESEEILEPQDAEGSTRQLAEQAVRPVSVRAAEDAEKAMAMRQGEPGERIQDQEDSDGQLQSTAREAAECAAAGGASQASPAKPESEEILEPQDAEGSTRQLAEQAAGGLDPTGKPETAGPRFAVEEVVDQPQEDVQHSYLITVAGAATASMAQEEDPVERSGYTEDLKAWSSFGEHSVVEEVAEAVEVMADEVAAGKP